LIGPGHLSGVRVVDVTRYTPGGYCTMLLADAGADVIKVERPGVGDAARSTVPRAGAHGIPFYTVNRSKRSVEIDLLSPEGQDEMQRLVKSADVVVESFRPGVAERLGISAAQLQAVNPSIVSCSISGYGQTGPLRGRPGHDINYLARTGALALSRDSDGRPVLPGVWLSDYAAGVVAAFAIASALLGRTRTGKGEVIDIGMADVMTQWLGDSLTAVQSEADSDPAEWPMSGRTPGYGFYRTEDQRFMALGAEEPEFWRALCERLRRPDLAEFDPLAIGETGRRVRAELEAIFSSRTRAAWTETFSDDEVPCDPVLDLHEAGGTEQIAAREMLVSTETIEGDRITIPGFAIKYGRAPCVQYSRAPALGEDNGKIDGDHDRRVPTEAERPSDTPGGRVFAYQLRTRYDEADVQGIVHNPRYLAYADIACVEWFREIAGSLSAANRAGLDVLVAESRVRYLRPAHADELIDLKLRVRELGDRSMHVETAMYRGDEPVAVAEMEYVFVDPVTLRPKPIAPHWRAKLARYTDPEDQS
jgi:YbgC/YbaW family acyl-CoA thioester hydrolase